MVRFFRQKNRVVGSVATPFMFWLLLGAGLDRSFQIPDIEGGYMVYFYPGTIMLVLLFTAIFSTISVIEDRKEGFLQGILVAPVPRLAIVMGKVLGGATIATVQGMIFLAFWPVIGAWPGIGMMAGAVGIMFLLSIGLTAMSMCFAWPCDSTAGYHAIMNLLLMPMWFLSGAMFPLTQSPIWMRVVMYANPLTYGQSALTAVLRNTPGDTGLLPMPLLIGISFGFTAFWVWVASTIVNRPRRDGTS